MLYIYRKDGSLLGTYDSIEEAYYNSGVDIRGAISEFIYRVEKAIKHKIYYYNLIFSNEKDINYNEYMTISEFVNKIKIGDYIGSQFIVSNIDKYKSGTKRFELQCLKCKNKKYSDYKGVIYCTKCKKCSLNKFRLSNDHQYWIGETQNGVEFYFNGDEDIIKYVKSFTWRENIQGYFQNSRGEKLHRVIMNVEDENIFVNHIGGNKYDCRKEMLSISNTLDNSKEKKLSKRNNTGIVGLMKRGKNNKYVGSITINDLSIYSKYKERNEAIIDLLIMQKHYGFRHNQDLYYLIDDIDENRYREVIDNCERQLNKKLEHKICSQNKIEISEDGKYYWVYDDDITKEINRFKVSTEDIDMIKFGKWHISYDKNNDFKTYVHGCIVINGKRKTVKLHRYLMYILDVKYKNWFVDHINGDGLDNRRQNLIITDAKGNGHKCNSKGYHERKERPGVYRASGTLGGIKYDRTFYNEMEAIEFVEEQRRLFFESRIKFKNKEELDKYLKKNELIAC